MGARAGALIQPEQQAIQQREKVGERNCGVREGRVREGGRVRENAVLFFFNWGSELGKKYSTNRTNITIFPKRS